MTTESDEHTKAYIAALEREARSQHADHAAIDAELERLGVDASTPHERAQKRPRSKSQTQKR